MRTKTEKRVEYYFSCLKKEIIAHHDTKKELRTVRWQSMMDIDSLERLCDTQKDEIIELLERIKTVEK